MQEAKVGFWRAIRLYSIGSRFRVGKLPFLYGSDKGHKV